MPAPPRMCSFFKTAAIDFCRWESISVVVSWRRSLNLEWLSLGADLFPLWQDLHCGRIAPVLVTATTVNVRLSNNVTALRNNIGSINMLVAVLSLINLRVSGNPVSS
jgi:hypothetical protein